MSPENPAAPTPAARPAHRRPVRTALAVAAAGVTALGTVALAQGPSVGAGASYSAAYTCTSSLAPTDTFALPLDVTVGARRSAGTTTLTVPGGSPVLSEKETYSDVRITTTLDAVVDGAPVQLAADRVVTIRPNEPVPLPDLVGTTTRPTGATLTFVPGTFVLVVRISVISATQTCLLDGAAPVATVPVLDPAAPSPTTPTDEAVTPILYVPQMSAKLTRKTQRVGSRPATVVVTLRPSRAGAAPAGQVKVSVGKRKVRTVTVSEKSARRAGAKGRTLRIALPKNLKPGRHTVKVHVSWKERELFGVQQRKLGIRVKKR